MKQPVVFVSNRIEKLTQLLNAKLFSNPTPFADQRVLLPDTSLKNSLMIELLTEEVDVISAVQFEELGSGIQSLFKLLTHQTLLFPPLDLLSLHLEALILDNQSELKSYFEGVSSQIELLTKAQSLASALAKEFLRYGKFGGPQLKKWLEQAGWQQKLWQQAFSKWNYPYELLDFSLQSPPAPVEVHLFNFPFLPNLYHRFFQKIASHVSVFYYQFSPCQEFWTDIASDQERFFMQKKEGFNPELDSYLESHNPLLANLGKLTRTTFRFFEDVDLTLEEHYTKPSDTLLGCIQTDILEDKTPKPQESFSDSSISLHPAHSKLREVEILYANLSQLSCLPSEVQIYAPNIASYAPYIELVFGSEESPFDFQVRDLPLASKSAFLQVFLDLLALPEQRFDHTSVYKLLSHPLICKRFHLEKKDVSTFFSWMKKLGVKWGLDPKHRDQLLTSSMLEPEAAGTWEHAFQELVKRLAFLPEKPSNWDLPTPDFSQAESLGLCITLIRSLKKDLDTLETSMTLNEWSLFFRHLIDTYIFLPEDEMPHIHFFYEKLNLLKNLAIQTSALFPYSSIQRFLMSAFKEKNKTLPAKQLECLTFSSLRPGNVFPAKITYLLGMHEGDFPRPYTQNSLTQFNGDFCPTTPEEDRALFLELLLLPSDRLYISYLQINEKDGKEQLPALPVQELLTYLETHYTIKPETLTSHHPPFPFHHESHALSFSKRHYQTALSFYEKKAPLPFIPEFLNPHPLPEFPKENLFISLKHLSACAKHPIRFYFNHVLGIYLRYEAQDEEFSLSALTKTLIQNHSLKAPFSEAFEEASAHGKLPLGRFKEVAALNLEQEIQTLERNLKSFGVQEVKPLSLSLTLPLSPQTEALIEGTLAHATPQGLLFSGDPKDLLKIWPEFLVFCCSNDHDYEKKLLFAKTGKILTLPEPQDALRHFIQYYTRALQTPSPFLPSWTQIFLKKAAPDLDKAITQKVKQGTDPYINWAFSHYSAPIIYETWASYLRETFSLLGDS